MARIFITGSSDGLGQVAARSLIAQGHKVTLHARNAERAEVARKGAPGAEGVLIGDLSSIAETKRLAEDANKTGRFDVVMHNAALGILQRLERTADGLPQVFQVNSLAPYILTCLMERPARLVYVSSGLHTGGEASLEDVTWSKKDRKWNGLQGYSDTKLHNVLLAYAAARRWKEVESNACSPGWVRTKLGGMGAPGSAERGAETQVQLAVGDGFGSGGYWASRKPASTHAAAGDIQLQEEYLKICERLSGIAFPSE